jgi:hypothetical protein
MLPKQSVRMRSAVVTEIELVDHANDSISIQFLINGSRNKAAPNQSFALRFYHS